MTKPLKYFRQESPYKAITMRLQLPDYRHKFEGEKFIKEMMERIKEEMENFRQFQLLYGQQQQAQLKILRDIVTRLMDFIKVAMESRRLEYRGNKEPTQWDVKRLLYLREYFVSKNLQYMNWEK